MEHLDTDILILGAGGAGLFAALHALQANPGLDVTVAVKGLRGKCGCARMVQGGYNVVVAPPDSIDRHFLTTLIGGTWLPRPDPPRRWIAGAVKGETSLDNVLASCLDRNP